MKVMIKRSMFLMVIFTIISLFSSFMIYTIEEGVRIQLDKNKLLSRDAKSIFIDFKDKPEKEYSLLNLKGDYTVLKDGLGAFNAYGVFFKGKLNNKPKLIKGRYFTEQDFNNNKKVALVGKDWENQLIEKDGKKYYYIENDNYEVIGIIGDDKKKSKDDYAVYINLDSLLGKDSFYLKGKYYIDGKQNTNNLIASLKEIYKDKNISVEEKEEIEAPLSKLLDGENNKIKLLVEIVIIFILNTVVITEYWIKNRKKEIGIKRALGSTKLKVSLSIIMELLLVSTISFVLGYIIFILITFVRDGYIHYYFNSTIAAFGISIISALITSLFPIHNASKMEPAEVMR